MAILRALLLLCVFVSTHLGAVRGYAAETKGLSEQELRAAALYQILHFTRWPQDTFKSPDEPLVVGIVGADPFGSLLDEMVEGESALGHPIKVVRVFNPENAPSCHVVYVSSSDELSATRALYLLRKKPVLTVGDAPEFCERGGIIALTVHNHRIRVLVNLGEARSSNVTLSSKLLRLAQIVGK